MQKLRPASRRSFLARVAGGGLILGAGTIFGANGRAAQPGPPETRQMVVDADPSDPARPPRPPGPSRPAADKDSGPNSDPHGTGAQANSQGPRERFVVCPGNPRCPR